MKPAETLAQGIIEGAKDGARNIYPEDRSVRTHDSIGHVRGLRNWISPSSAACQAVAASRDSQSPEHLLDVQTPGPPCAGAIHIEPRRTDEPNPDLRPQPTKADHSANNQQEAGNPCS
jgi:hypothetical protein